ncbi:MAG: transferase [Burkholderiales bacterium]|nr:transferase [Phycisphaerae bacterium]
MDDRPESDIELGAVNQNPRGMSFFGLLREDFETHERDLLSQGFWAIGVHRYGNWRMGIGNRWLRLPFSIVYKLLYKLVEWTCGISLAYTVRVGRRVRIWHQGGMTLGALEIGNDVHVRQNTTFGVKRRGDPRWMKPIIGDRCDIGCGAVIVGPITIGHDSVIGANVVIAKDVPPNSIVTVEPPLIKEKKSQTLLATLPRLGSDPAESP